MVIRSRRSFISIQEKVKIVAEALKRARTERRRLDVGLIRGYIFDIFVNDLGAYASMQLAALQCLELLS